MTSSRTSAPITMGRSRRGWLSRLPRPASLRSRVTLSALLLLTVILIVLFTAVDLALSERLNADARTRLTDRAALAQQLDGSLSPQQLVDRLRGDGVTAQLCPAASSAAGAPSNGADGSATQCVVASTAPAPPGTAARPAGPKGEGKKGKAAPVPVRTTGSVLFVSATLGDGHLLTLSTDTTQIASALGRLVLLEVVGGSVALLAAALLLSRISRVALRPLDDMTALARQIARGDRGRRLDSEHPHTELGRTAAAFDAMLDELERSATTAQRGESRMRAFLGDASHELRTPLAGLQASSESLLREQPDRVEQEQIAVTMVRETRRAALLVEDLLTIARLDGEAEQPALRRERVDLASVAHQEVERARRVAVEVALTFTGGALAIVQGDPLRLGQIVSNLLDNARHVTSRGGHIDVTVTSDESSATVTVTDDGPGVPAHDRERIFERFVRLDESRSRHTGGAGLGLPIARALARAQGGDLTYVDVTARTPAGTGASFRLTLPLTTESKKLPPD